MEIPDEKLKKIRESGYNQELIISYISELLDSYNEIKDNNNLELKETTYKIKEKKAKKGLKAT